MKKNILIILAAYTSLSGYANSAIRPGFTGTELFRNDDRSSPLVSIGFDINFFGVTRNSLYVNNNGNVTFGRPFATYNPSELDLSSTEIIAPFLADVDTRDSLSGVVTYGTGRVAGNRAFGANWVDVGYFSSKVDLLNSFQLVIVEAGGAGSGNFNIEFNYEQIQWEAGDVTGVDGFGADSARVGYSNGDGTNLTEFEGSGESGALVDGGVFELIAGSVFGGPGRYLFAIRDGKLLAINGDFTNSLLSGFTAQVLAKNLPALTLNGSHHRILMDTQVAEGGWHTWVTGDFSSNDKLNAEQTVGEIGASRYIGCCKDFRFGIGLGSSSVDQDMTFNGQTEIEGNFILTELDYRLPESSVVVSALAYYGDWDADVSRGYLTSGSLDSSRGSTDISSFALRLRADWQDSYVNGRLSVTPRLSYTFTDTQGDSYTETGGGFPIQFDGQDDQEHEVRLGADVDFAVSDKTEIRAIAELVHSFDDAGSLSGNIISLGDFDFDTDELETTWGRLGLELGHQLTENQLVRASVFTTTEGSDATVSGSLSYSINF